MKQEMTAQVLTGLLLAVASLSFLLGRDAIISLVLQALEWQTAHPKAGIVQFLIGSVIFGALGIYALRKGEKAGITILAIACLLIFGSQVLTRLNIRFITQMMHSSAWYASWTVSLLTAGTLCGLLAMRLLWSAMSGTRR